MAGALSSYTGWQKRLVSALVLGPLTLAVIWVGGPPFLVMLVLCTAICLYEWVNITIRSRYRAVFLPAGILYICFSFWACYLIRESFETADNAFAFVIMIWASDIGAYVVGKLVGGPKMAPTISPKKTWAGFCGALLLPAAAMIMFMIWRGGMPEASHALFFFLFGMIGVVVGFTGQAGDLLISFFKRDAKVKDAGQLIPGHGGLIDRVDSMMLAAPVYFGVLEWVESVFIVS